MTTRKRKRHFTCPCLRRRCRRPLPMLARSLRLGGPPRGFVGPGIEVVKKKGKTKAKQNSLSSSSISRFDQIAQNKKMPTDRPFRVNTKKVRSAAAKAECAEELGALFSCMMVRRGGGGGGGGEKNGNFLSVGRRRRASIISFLPCRCSQPFSFSFSDSLFLSSRATSTTSTSRVPVTGGRWTRASRRR